MKKYFLLAFVALMCVACEKRQEVLPDDEPQISIQLVKFTDDKYREYIIGHRSDKGYIQMPTDGKAPIAEVLITGTNPFHEKLPNGYWVVNWRWGHTLFYPSNAVLLKYKWETLSDWSHTWEIPDTIISYNQFIEDYLGITRLAIDEHLGINYKRPSEMYDFLYLPPWIWYKELSDIPSEDVERYHTCVLQQDSLHAIYVKRLTDIINNGDFDELRAK